MADNTILNAGTGGDTVRAVAKTANSPAKTQINVIDVGGAADGSAEKALVAGQQTAANSLSTVPASDALAEPGGAAITGASMPSGGVGLTGWLSAIWTRLGAGLARSWTLSSGTDSVSATVANASLAVTGTFYQATQPVSAASLPLPTGAAQEAGGNLALIAGYLATTLPGVSDAGGALAVQGVTGGVPVPVTLANAALESGGNLAALSAAFVDAQQPETQSPLQSRIVGKPDGDFAGVDLIERLMDPVSGEAANVKVINQPLVGADGAIVISDATTTYAFVGSAAGLFTGPGGAVGGWIDTKGFAALLVQFTTTASTTVAFHGSNDGVTFSASNICCFTTVGGANINLSVTSVAGACYIVPCTTRFIRPYISAYTSGTAALVIVPRASPIPFFPANQAVGGNVAVGVASVASPVPGGGTDQAGLARRIETDSNGATIAAGALAPGWSFGSYNVSYSPFTTASSSLSAALSAINPIVVGGGDTQGRAQRLLTAPNGSAFANHEQQTAQGQSLVEMMAMLIAIERARLNLEAERFRSEFGAVDDPEMMIAEIIGQQSIN